jgi:hypothetical protein
MKNRNRAKVMIFLPKSLLFRRFLSIALDYCHTVIGTYVLYTYIDYVAVEGWPIS